MKHRTILIMMLLAVCLIAACGQGANEVESTATAMVAEEPPIEASETIEEIAPVETPEPPAEEEESAAVDEEASEPVLVPTAAPETEAAEENTSATSVDYANVEQGIASYLSDALHGGATADGGTYDKDAYVAAHKDLPFGAEVRVTNLANGKSVVVTIIDRMPSNNPHLIDVSYVAAVELEMLDAGNIDASVEWDE